ncbi:MULTISPECIES: leucyl aminopeptidase [Prochlorococcus]|uniref:Probable cytosol aminopeptidase n=1 Tax=Prochlorococcus marinus str. MIT 9116 TaxID=167544 RepID=A0A0A1ZYF3_PROMR|nr:leucyl aminopeptidase [Prochlorococcus marinus]KGF91630.1 Cytosol aminopeptidase PepA [Prochlorococcus marinus str. MIT 9107]KGF93183.1 Cytosol aminopeptidase PepA [Prochlorococcus marinus str. MIT 9116]KGF94222.1 Cytosol aminopeptidase PepA [Prochlorococcus marinus str. MIT 9123]
MQFSTFQNDLNDWHGNSLIFGVVEEDIEIQVEKIKFVLDPQLLLKKITKKKFKGEKGEILDFEFLDQKLETLIIIGLGKSGDLNKGLIKNSLGDLVRKLVDKNDKISILLPWELINSKLEIHNLAESARLSAYKDNRFNKKKDEKNVLNEIEFLNLNKFKNISFEETENICEGVELARRLVAAPPNSLTPQEMSIIASKIGKEHDLEVKILDAKECEDLGMGAYLAVAKGSDLKPKFIHLTLKADGPIKEKIALVGKGLTFDSGGYNLKVGASQIEMMKYDMGGSAAVLGAAKALGAIKPKGLEIHFIVAACENMINGSAVHPGDVVKASNGKTIEINNTDAEGRLTLADALTYASNLKPDSIIDLATLTGAIVIALGNDVAGFWSNNDDLADDLKTASTQAGEELWQMPLQKSYKEGLKSHIADMKNTGPRAGGSITAALFLEEFFDKEIKWAHIDIAGTCWTDKNNGINPSGATGFGVKTLVQWIKNK